MDQLTDSSLEALPPEVAEMLPEEILQALEMEKVKKREQIEQIGQVVAKMRDEAVNARAGSGIETEWQEDEDAYQGIDDINRSSHQTYKPLSHTGASVLPRKGDSARSTVFLNITRPYTDAGAARVSDMLLPTDDKNWSIKPTPVPQLDQILAARPNVSQPAPASPTGAVPPGQPAAPDPMQAAVAQAMQIMDAARQKAEAAERQIEDWLVECQWHAEVRKAIENCARLGTGVMKGPTPVKRKRMRATQDQNGMALQIAVESGPASKSVSPWNIYPDLSVGEEYQKGRYFFEKDEINARGLRDLKGLPGYIDEMIDKVLEEGPGKKYASNLGTKDRVKDDDTFEIWYGYMLIDKADLESLNVDPNLLQHDMMPAIVTLVNDSPVRASLNPLDSGEYPYDLMPWQRRQGSPFGVGIARQMRTPQRMLNAATRNMMDNAGLSGGPQIVLRRNVIEPVDGSWTLVPRKFWYVKEDADAKSVADAIMAINIPNMQAELMNIINFALKMAEDTTGLPMIMQGQLGTAPDTVGGMQMLTNNASTVLRRIARTFDDCITEPHIRRYYEFLMMYGPEECKGDYCIDARGSTALVERDLQNQAILQMGAMVLNPTFEMSPAKWIREAMKAQRLDPKKFEMDEQEKAAIAQQQAPEAPQVTVAKIRSQTDLQRAKMDMDRDAVYAQAEKDKVQIMAMSRREELLLKREIAYLEAQMKRGINVDQNKVKLADTAMRLRTQKELALLGTKADLHKFHTPQVATPAMEPPGRAQPGQAFQA